MERYERLFERTKKTKYKVGDTVRLINDFDSEYFVIAEVLKVNEDMEIPDYYIQTFYKSNNKEVSFWAEDSEILKKANSKDKQLFKDKKK